MDQRTIEEWEKEFETVVWDGDGFPAGTRRTKTLFTKEEFLNNCWGSTIVLSKEVTTAMDKLKMK